MASLTDETAAQFGVAVLQGVHDQLRQSDPQRKFLMKAIALLGASSALTEALRFAETYLRAQPPQDVVSRKVHREATAAILRALARTTKARKARR